MGNQSRVVIVTGASQGIGKGLVSGFRARGITTPYSFRLGGSQDRVELGKHPVLGCRFLMTAIGARA
jgi:NAD(P)-dependent dehydrogenase (short-subunit alcohol dehydrogenase family)